LLLGVLINKATGTTYAKWVEEVILNPAGIVSSGVIGQDHFGFGQADGNIRLTLEDWIRFSIWVKNNENGNDCFANYVRSASTTKIANSIKREGKAFEGYGYLIWTENTWQKDSYWAVGYGGQRIGWNHKNNRILIAFSNIENYMDDLYRLYGDWSSLKK
jgi:CubicO group peptidase (beta-lactamase class C family)